MRKHGAWSSAILVALLILITGCKSQSLSFISESELPYDKDFNVCSLVETVNEQRIPMLLNDGKEIHYQGDVITCNSNNIKLDPNKKLSIDFDFNGTVFTKEITFVEAVAEVPPLIEQPKPIVPEQKPTVEVPPVDQPEETETVTDGPPEEHPETEEIETQPPYVPEVPVSNVGEHRKFPVSETVSIFDAQNACVAYASQYTNFSGCRDVRDSNNLIIRFETY
ncbi:hypothetical protein G7062_10540 [Erysipelothrix sp. HDW6C]|uniref:hypothetical protein n=1 Tax=Erysipelothrix sp. HDW6C TaxID=2714930 RepID=UPI00140C34E7|nr:hypothetical protein [Erysipelothrix sp. HDW6C]QIK70714.1 hypothetical protein G7062_10540 [Erysipelothrix sp. HDW6C]